MGTPLSEIALKLPTPPSAYLAAMVNNRIKELSYRIYKPSTIRLIDGHTFEGSRVIQRTAIFLFINSRLHLLQIRARSRISGSLAQQIISAQAAQQGHQQTEYNEVRAFHFE